MKTAVIAGVTGLVGGELLKQILTSDQYMHVIALTRRDLPLSHPRLQKIITDFRDLEQALDGVRPHSVFCCLGTTMAKAGSKATFREVDFEYPLSLARVTHGLGGKNFVLVSALGAHKESMVYYNRVKGAVEEAIGKVGFESYHIFRPSLLFGPRDEKRPGEDAAKVLYKVFGFLIPRRYKGIEAGTVARAMLVSSLHEAGGTFIHESDQIQQYS